MKLSLNVESTDMLIKAKELSGLNFNSLLKEAMELLLNKYTNQQYEDQHDQQQRKHKPS